MELIFTGDEAGFADQTNLCAIDDSCEGIRILYQDQPTWYGILQEKKIRHG